VVSRFQHLRIPAKLAAIILIAVLGFAVMGWLNVRDIRPRELDARKVRTQQLVEAARSVVAGFYAEEKSGKLSHAQTQRRAIDALAGMSYGASGYFWINDMTPVMIMHPKEPSLNGKNLANYTDPTGKHLFTAMVDIVKADGAGFVNYQWPKPDSTKAVPKLSYVAGFAPWHWIVGTGIYIDDVDAAVWSATISVLVQTLLVVGAILLILFLVGRSILGPIRKLSHALTYLSKGDHEASAKAGGDELVETAVAFRELTGYLHDTTALADRIAAGDLSIEVSPRSERDLLGHATATMVSNLRTMLTGMTRAATSVSSAAREMASNSDEAGRAISEIAQAVSDVAVGAEQQARVIEQAKASTSQTAEAAEATRLIAREGVEAAMKASDAMDGVRASSAAVDEAIGLLAAKLEQIGGIVVAITTIADQTNLLALNAAIEAAHAGDQGRGFAVVADEVRKLAEESHQAAATIATLVAEIQGDTARTVSAIEDGARRSEQGVETVEVARKAFEEIGRGVEDVTRQVDEIAEAMNQVAAVAEQSSASTQEVAASAEQTSASTQTISASAAELANTAEELSALTSRFTLGGTVDFAAAREKHLMWKGRLRDFLAGKEALRVGSATDHTKCDLGKWLHGAGMAQHGELPDMQELERAHIQLHAIVKAVIQAKEAGREAVANQELARADETSNTIVRLLSAVEQKLADGYVSTAGALAPAA
jgi:methyl-accepting chemotaxis protein